MPNPVDFFIHIPKTAGTTLAQIIASQYPRGSVLTFPDPQIGDDERARAIRQMPEETRIVAGHLHFGYTELCPRGSRPFTMLRDPVERFISLYYYIGREPKHHHYAAFQRGELRIGELAERQGRAQACFIAGMLPKDACPDDELIARATENLEKTIVSVGLTERFDESLLLYNRALGWKVEGYARENVTRNRPTQDRLAPQDLSIIREKSAVDQQVYDFASRLFEKRIADMPPTFAEELAALRRKVTKAETVSWIRSGLSRVKSALSGQRALEG